MHHQNKLYQCQLLTQELSIKQLSLRRHEKDLFFRKQQKYLKRWQQMLSELKQDFDQIKPCFAGSEPHVDFISDSILKLKSYEASFLLLVSELNKEDKQSLSILNSLVAQQELLEKRAKITDNNVYAQTLAIRQHLFEYITSEQAISLQLLSNNVQSLSQWTGLGSELQSELSRYLKQINTLKQFVESHQYSHEAGTMGKMRSNIHRIEEILPKLMRYLEGKADIYQSLRWVVYLLILLTALFSYHFIKRIRPK